MENLRLDPAPIEAFIIDVMSGELRTLLGVMECSISVSPISSLAPLCERVVDENYTGPPCLGRAGDMVHLPPCP